MQDYVTNYEEAVAYVYRIPRFNKNHSLEKIQHFLTRMGQPDRQMKVVHIAGTNGKGSTSAYLAGLLEKAGLKVGLFTSPHLVDVRERFQVNGVMISKELFTEAVRGILRLLATAEDGDDYQPCYFDVMFFIGMYAFKKEQVDILVLETGLGGRLDATNAVTRKVLTLITHIALDHTEYLGDTLEAIAAEKAGIMRAQVPCIVGLHNEEVAHIFVKKATELGSFWRILEKEVYGCLRVYEKSVAFSYFSSYYGIVDISLNTSALYQVANASLALAAFEQLITSGIIDPKFLSAEMLQDALLQTSWPGRMEEVRPGVFLDGAHNVDGIQAFLDSVRQDGCKGKRILVFSAVGDKRLNEMVHELDNAVLFSQIIVTEVQNARGITVLELLSFFLREKTGKSLYTKTTAAEAMELAINLKKQKDYIYVAGSLYLVGEIKNYLTSANLLTKEEQCLYE